MKTKLIKFLLKWAIYCLVLYTLHSFLFATYFPEKELYFPLWAIYLFNGALVLAVYLIIMFAVSRGYDKPYNIFLGLTVVKMLLAIIFLSPLVAGKSPDAVTETLNFFAPYFLLLVCEIFQLGRFLQAR